MKTKIDKYPKPAGLCKSCINKAAETGQQYCEHNQAGAVYLSVDGFAAWQVYTPTTRQAFEFVIAAIRSSKVTITMPEPAPTVKTHD